MRPHRVLRRAIALWRMPYRTRMTTARALCITPLVEIGLHALPLPELCAYLGIRLATQDTPPKTTTQTTDITCQRVREVQHATEVALRAWGRKRNCLRRALIAGYVLKPHTPELRLGARRGLNGFEAHAWLDVGGVRIDSSGAAAAEFRQLFSRRKSANHCSATGAA